MRNMKKLLSLVLCVALAAALMLPMSFASAEGSNAHGITTMGDSVSTGYGLIQTDPSWANGELTPTADGQLEYVKRPLGMHVMVPTAIPELWLRIWASIPPIRTAGISTTAVPDSVPSKRSVCWIPIMMLP